MSHHAKDTSPRLARAIAVLQRCGSKGVTSFDWMLAARICSASTAAHELRRNGWDIECEREGTTPGGGKLFRYTLKGRKGNAC